MKGLPLTFARIVTFSKEPFCFQECASMRFFNSTKVCGLDAVHIKARYGGVLLVLTVLDGDGHVFPVAIGIAEGENKETWGWFVALVKTALRIDDGGRGIVVLSDREKGIDNAVTNLLPGASHSFCTYHIQKNVKALFKSSLNGLVFETAKAWTEEEFAATIEKMKEMNTAAGNNIANIDPTKWARSWFPAQRMGHVTSNMSESMNWWLEDVRHLCPVEVFEAYIEKLNVLFEKGATNTQQFNNLHSPRTSRVSFQSPLRSRGDWT